MPPGPPPPPLELMTPFTSIVIFVPAVKAAIALALVKYKFVNSGTFAVLNPPILSGEIAPGAIILAVTEFGERDVDNDPFCASNVTEFAPVPICKLIVAAAFAVSINVSLFVISSKLIATFPRKIVLSSKNKDFHRCVGDPKL